MAYEGEQDRDEAASEAESDDGFDASFDAAFADSGDGESEDTDDEADGEATAAASDAPEEKATPPTAEELGLDPKNPAEKAIFDKALRTWTKWASRHDAKHKAEAKQPEQPKQEQPAQPQRTPADDPVAQVYKVDYSGFKPKFREDSILAEYGEEFAELFGQFGDYTLQSVYQNDQNFRQQLQQQEQAAKVSGVIGAFVEDVRDHPELKPDANGRLSAIGQKFVEVAQRYESLKDTDPELYLELIESKSGIARGWRGEAGKQTAERGKEHQRIAKKPLANMARTTSAQRTSTGSRNRTDMKPDEAFESNWERHFGHGR